MKKYTLVVVDDHKLIRQMWTKLFARHEQIEITGESGQFDEAVELIKEQKPDVVLLDINLDGASGLDAVPLIREYSPNTKIIGVSMYNQPAYAKKMLRLGAMGYVTKNSSHEEMMQALDAVLNNKVYVCEEIKNTLTDELLNDEQGKPNINALSLREIEILKLIKYGFSSKEISDKLAISVRTAEVHRHNIMKKLHFRNTASLITFINKPDVTL